MDAAVLRVLVQARGIVQTAKDLRNLDRQFAGAERAAQAATRAVLAFGRLRAHARVALDGANRVRGQLAALTRGFRDGDSGIRRFGRSLGDLPGRIYLSTRLLGALMNLMLTMAPVLVGVAAQLFAVGAALAPLVGLAAGAAGGVMALAQGFSVLKLATSGIGGALKEQLATQDQIGPAATKSANATLQAADAERNAARTIQAAQEGVRTARLGVRDAARAVQDALRGVDDAERGVADAQRQAKAAQEALADARTGALRDLQDLKEALSDTQRSLGPAQLDLIEAQETLAKVLADGTSTWIERARAQQAVADATDRVSDTQREIARLTFDVVAANRDGIRGAEGVVAAQRAVEDADRGVIDAKRQVADAERNVTQAREAMTEASRTVAKAIDAVRDAQLDAKASAAAADAATVGAAASAGKLTDEFDKLPPAAQKFVQALVGLKPKLDELRATAASGLFPGVTSGLQKAMGSFDEVNSVVGKTATELGGVADSAGALVGSPAFGKDIETIGGRNAKILGVLGQAGVKLASAFRHLLVAAGPLTTWMAKVAGKWASSADEAARTGRETGKLAAYFERTKSVAQTLGSIIGNLAGGLAGLAGASRGAGGRMLKDFEGLTQRFSDWANSAKGRNTVAEFMEQARQAMNDVGPALGAIVKAFTRFAVNVLPAYARVMQALSPVMTELVTAFIAWKIAATAAAIATGVWTGLTKLAAAAQWLLNIAMRANPLGLIVTALVALAAGLVLAYKKSETFREIVDKVWAAIKTVVGSVIDWLAKAIPDAWEWIKGATEKVWDAIGKYVEAWWKAVKTVVTTYIDVVKTVITTAWNVIKRVTETVWGAISGFFTTWWKGVKTVFTTYIDIVKTVLSTAWETIKRVADVAWDGIKAVIVNPVRGAFDAVRTAVSNVKDWLRERWQDMKAGATDMWQGIRDGIANPIRTAFEWVRTAVTNAKDWIRERWEDIKTGATTLWQGIRDAIANPIRTAVEWVKGALGADGLGGWLGDKWQSLSEGAKTFAGNFKEAIVDGIRGAANKVLGFVNKIIGVINKIPGVEIGKIKGLAAGGTVSRAGADQAQELARGGKVMRPMAIVGEESPRHPEFVIASNPAYRSRNLKLLAMAANALGAPMGAHATGGALGRQATIGGIPAYGVGGFLKDAAGKAKDVAGDVVGAHPVVKAVKHGVKWFIDKLPEPADFLPDWMLGMGDWMIDKAVAFIKDEVPGLAKGGVLPFLGTFHNGGVAQAEGLAHVAKGETMTPQGRTGPLVHIENLNNYHGEYDEDRLARKLGFIAEYGVA